MSSVQPERAAFVPVATDELEDPAGAMPGTATEDQPEGGNIDKIRDIIFGGQMRDYERRFMRLETRLIKESTDLREETKRRFDVLEMFIKREFEALAERLQIEQRHREESVQTISRTLAETAHGLESKLAQSNEVSARADADLRQHLLDQSKSLSDEIQRKHAEISTIVEQEIAHLHDDKPSRTHLATMFTELAARLNGDLKVANKV
jgi:hypothetical protein